MPERPNILILHSDEHSFRFFVGTQPRAGW